MRSVFRTRAFGIICILTLLPQFQNCAPSSATFNDVPPPAQSASVDPGAPIADAVLRGTVTNALTNAALGGVSIRVRKAAVPAETVASLTSGASGTYQSGGLEPGNYYVDFTLTGFIPAVNVPLTIKAGQESVLNQSLSTILSDGQIRVVLNWSDPKTGAVEDVDAYLVYPGAVDPLFFNSRTGDGVKLDIDVRHWRGPETVTISTVKTGTYIYYVNNYSARFDNKALGLSEVKVAVYKGSQQLKMYSVPVGTGITYEVFRIENGNIVDVLKYNDTLRIAW